MEKVLLRFRSKKCLNIFTKNLNFEFIELIKILEKLNIIYEVRVQDYDVQSLKTSLFYLRKYYIYEYCSLQGLCPQDCSYNFLMSYYSILAHLLRNLKNKRVVLSPSAELFLKKSLHKAYTKILQPTNTPVTSIDFNLFYFNMLGGEFPYGSGELRSGFSTVDLPGFYEVRLRIGGLAASLTAADETLVNAGEGQEVAGIFWHEEVIDLLGNGSELLEIGRGLIFKKKARVYQKFYKTLLQLQSQQLIKKLSHYFFGALLGKPHYYKYGVVLTESALMHSAGTGMIRNFHKINGIYVVQYSQIHFKKSSYRNAVAGSIILARGRTQILKIARCFAASDVYGVRTDEVILSRELTLVEREVILKKFDVKIGALPCAH